MSWDHISASQLGTYLGCNRKWWLEKIGSGGRSEESPSQALGKAVHKVIEQYLRGEIETLDHPLLTMNTFVDSVKSRPNVELLIEHEFMFRLGAKPIMGFIDLMIVDRVGQVVDIWDHKTTKDWKYAKTEAQLLTDPQALVYVAEAARLFPGYLLRFGHHVIHTQKVQIQRTTDLEKVSFDGPAIERAVAYVEMVAGAMIRDAGTLDGRDVAPNLGECYKYGGCAFRARCKGDEPMPSLEELNKPDPKIFVEAKADRTWVAYDKQTVYVDCLPLKDSAVVHFSDWVAGLEAKYKAEVGQDYIATDFGKGVTAIATAARDTLTAPPFLFIRSGDAAGMRYLRLVESSVRVVQSVR